MMASVTSRLEPLYVLLLTAISLLLVLLLSQPARADIVHLKNGTHVEGEVTPGGRPGYLKVTLDKGMNLEYHEDDVLRIENKISPAREFEEKLAEIDPDDVDELLLLVEWARERKLRTKVEKVFQLVLKIDPNDPIARRGLGYTVFQNRWVREEELKKEHGLIRFRGDWLTPREKERRLREDLEREIVELLRGVDSDNQYIRKYSIKKLMEYRDPRVRGVIMDFLSDPREAVRVVAVKVLADLLEEKSPRSSRKKEEKVPVPTEEEVARALLDLTLHEESVTVRTSLSSALNEIGSRKYFEYALKILTTSANPLHRDRCAEGIYFALQKTWVEELIRSVSTRPPGIPLEVAGNPQVRDILQKIFREDFQYRLDDWLAWWARNQYRFRDE